jgi:hypothetical protein
MPYSPDHNRLARHTYRFDYGFESQFPPFFEDPGLGRPSCQQRIGLSRDPDRGHTSDELSPRAAMT